MFGYAWLCLHGSHSDVTGLFVPAPFFVLQWQENVNVPSALVPGTPTDVDCAVTPKTWPPTFDERPSKLSIATDRHGSVPGTEIYKPTHSDNHVTSPSTNSKLWVHFWIECVLSQLIPLDVRCVWRVFTGYRCTALSA